MERRQNIPETINPTEPVPAAAQETGLPTSTDGGSVSADVSTPIPQNFGRYRILKKLGEGGMGAVYLAHDAQLDRPVALKVPHFAADAQPSILERFHREARAAATLQHQNLCPVYDVGELNGIHYLIMAYVQGKPLSEAIEVNKALPPDQAVAIIRQLALALAYAHRHGIIHRDLKPSNVMMNEAGEPIIMDFGLARRDRNGAERLTRTGEIMGTPAYMPPEQVEGNVDNMGPGCDIYSLGVMLYELLTGQLPFRGSIANILSQIMTRPPEPPSVHCPHLDARLNAVCLKAMAKKPEDRYRSMEDLAAALTGYLGKSAESQEKTLPIQTELAVPAEETIPAKIRRWWKVAAIGCVAMGAVIIAAFLYFRTEQGTIKIDVPEKDVDLLIDGQPLRPEELDQPIALKPGSHDLTAKRGGRLRLNRSFTVERGPNPTLKIERSLTFEPAAPAVPTGESFALLIGVDQYESVQAIGRPANLACAQNDVSELAKVLCSGGYRPENVLAMSTKEAEHPHLVPRSANIRRQLKTLARSSEPLRSLLVVFSGYEVQFSDSDEYYLCPSDAKTWDKQSLISLDDVYRELEQCRAHSKLLIVDSCRALETKEGRALRPKLPPADTAVLFACSGGENAYEVKALGHGLLSYFLIQGLGGAADANSDGTVTQDELLAFVQKSVPDYARSKMKVVQTPELLGRTPDLVLAKTRSKPD